MRKAALTTVVHRPHSAAIGAIAAACLTMVSLATVSPTQAVEREIVADITEAVIDSVVAISVTLKASIPNQAKGSRKNFSPRSPIEKSPKDSKQPDKNAGHAKTSSGSGFVIDPGGLIATSFTVVTGASKISVTLNDGTKLDGEIVGLDKRTDIALVRVKPAKRLKAVTFGDSDKLRVGQRVLAIGNPYKIGNSVTTGIVSGRNRDIGSGPYDNFIQTDAAINKGNSGGPLFDYDGKVMGINTAIFSPSGGSVGIAFAVPSKTVVHVLDQLQKFGEVRRGWLGVQVQPVTDEVATSLNIEPARGALVAGVDDKGPAKPAGIVQGDVIVKFDGNKVRGPRELARMVADTPVGKEVEVIVLRKGKEEKRKVTLGLLPTSNK